MVSDLPQAPSPAPAPGVWTRVLRWFFALVYLTLLVIAVVRGWWTAALILAPLLYFRTYFAVHNQRVLPAWVARSEARRRGDPGAR
ncbi:MAG: hypothetical protein QOG52_1499 [Frankiaceae bacterium]|nr:hypothetical protein [Frankiaceae bacterium]